MDGQESESTRDDLEPEQDSYAGGWQGDRYYIGGIHISIDDHPDCLDDENADCETCLFFTPETCPLRMFPRTREDIKTLFAIHREQQVVYRRHQQFMIDAIQTELEAHGRPLHYAVLARIVRSRHPELGVTETGVLNLMASHESLFVKVRPGVYRCR